MRWVHPFVSAILKSLVAFLLLMSAARLWFYVHFSPYPSLPKTLQGDWLNAMWLGFRLDLSVLGYVSAVAFVMLALMQWTKRRNRAVARILIGYLWGVFVLISAMLGADAAFYSYFGEHANILIFGVMDDDTVALLRVAWENYNIPLIAVGGAVYGYVLWRAIAYAFASSEESPIRKIPAAGHSVLLVGLIALSVLSARGSLGHFPIAKNIVDVSPDPFVNQLPQNGVYAITKAYSLYKKSKSDDYDLIGKMGYSKTLPEAFRIHTGTDVDPSDLIGSLHRRTPKNGMLEERPPHVVVVMVESFGLPITEYQSPTFDIMGRLKKHFDQDTVFRNFISGSNGTIVSLEPLLLNIAARPDSTSFGQSSFLSTSFIQAAAKVYQSKGYETSFVYGGDLSWRNVGTFMKRQGFDNVEGKAAIVGASGKREAEISHSWGVFDQYAYDFVHRKLTESKKPQFVFLLTTNNHPPYDIPADYTSRPLEWTPKMSTHMKGDKSLLERRLRDYAYALDMAGRFMDAVKSGPEAGHTVVAITADNNTIESAMKYEDTTATSKKIPFYLYLPDTLKKGKILDPSVPGSHKDLFPTLYGLTLSDAGYISMGTDLLDSTRLHCGFNDAGIIVSKEGAFVVDKPANGSQEACNRYYKATLAAGEYLIMSHRDQSWVKEAK